MKPAAASTRLRLEAPTALQARFVRPTHRIPVTFVKPVEHGRPQKMTGDLLGVMHARGALHHYRIAAESVVWIVPPIWLTPASAAAVTKAMEPPKRDFAQDMAAVFRTLTAQWAMCSDAEVMEAMRRSKRRDGR